MKDYSRGACVWDVEWVMANAAVTEAVDVATVAHRANVVAAVAAGPVVAVAVRAVASLAAAAAAVYLADYAAHAVIAAAIRAGATVDCCPAADPAADCSIAYELVAVVVILDAAEVAADGQAPVVAIPAVVAIAAVMVADMDLTCLPG